MSWHAQISRIMVPTRLQRPGRLAKDGYVKGDQVPDRSGWTQGIRRAAVLTGAGISTDSGIPDFRGPSGLWTRDPAAEKMSTYQVYVADPAVRPRSWQGPPVHPAWTAHTTP